jgi:Ni/Co efflux regulator RcnB
MSFQLWLRAGAIATLSLALSTTITLADEHGHGHGHGKHDRDDDDDHDRDHGDRDHDHHDHGHHGYSDHDRDEMRGWYRQNYKHLPPGLAERDRLSPGLERQLVVRGTLPPGLRRKMQRCPEDMEYHLPPPPPDCEHVLIGGHVVLLNRTTFLVVDVFHFELH